MKGLTITQFDQTCRTCLSQSEEIARIFEVAYGNTNLWQIFRSCLAIEIERDDSLPQHICTSCIMLLVQVHTFVQQCQRSDVILRAFLEEHNAGVQCPRNEDEENNQGSCDSANEVKNEIDTNLLAPVQENHQIADEKSKQTEKLVPHCNFKEEIKDEIDLPDQIEYTEEENPVNKDIIKPNNVYHCSYCSVSFNSYIDFIAHRKRLKHPVSKHHKCPECNKSFTSSGLKEHMRTHTREKPFVCHLCQKSFRWKHNLRKHVMTHTGETPHTCDICGKGFIRAAALTEHRRIHTGEKPYVCSYCGRSFSRAKTHKSHLRKHFLESREVKEEPKNGKPSHFKCDVCLKSFKHRNTLNTHKLIHREKRFLCTHCGKTFIHNAALLTHMKVHTGEKPYSCSVCNRKFAQSGAMKTHVLTHTGEKPYSCSVCKKNFTQKGAMKSHMLTHTGEKRYVCLVCNKNYTQYHNLKLHKLAHTGEKPFTCKVCAKAFTQRILLVYHMRTHTGEKPYACTSCGKAFALKTNMMVHMRIHTGEIRHVCDLCGKGFYDSSSMKKHRRRHEMHIDKDKKNNFKSEASKKKILKN